MKLILGEFFYINSCYFLRTKSIFLFRDLFISFIFLFYFSSLLSFLLCEFPLILFLSLLSLTYHKIESYENLDYVLEYDQITYSWTFALFSKRSIRWFSLRFQLTLLAIEYLDSLLFRTLTKSLVLFLWLLILTLK